VEHAPEGATGSRTPAAELAGVQVTYSGWCTERRGDLFTARERNGTRVLRAATIAGLENQLIRIDWLMHTGRQRPRYGGWVRRAHRDRMRPLRGAPAHRQVIWPSLSAGEMAVIQVPGPQFHVLASGPDVLASLLRVVSPQA
jgi:hypothetical protein